MIKNGPMVFSHVLVNPSLTEEDYAIYPHERLSAPGFSELKALLPFVIAQEDLPEEIQTALRQEALQRGDAVMFMHAEQPLKALAADLSLNLVQDRAGTKHHFWYFATTILTYLKDFLSPPQLGALFNGVSEWHCHDGVWANGWWHYQQADKRRVDQVLTLTPEQWALVDLVPLAIHIKSNLADVPSILARDYPFEGLSVALVQKRLDMLGTPLQLLLQLQVLTEDYPNVLTAHRGEAWQLFVDDLITPAKARAAYEQTNQAVQNTPDGYWDYRYYSKHVFERAA